MSKKEKPKGDNSDFKWFITVFIVTFILSIIFSYISTNAISALELFPATLVLVITVFIGILFDIIGVAVTVANEDELHAKASRKINGAKTSIKLIKNSHKVANLCADVIGDICGVLSGAIAALITFKVTEKFKVNFDLQFIISAMVASLTVVGKAVGKGIAKKNSTKIVHAVGIVIEKFSFRKK